MHKEHKTRGMEGLRIHRAQSRWEFRVRKMRSTWNTIIRRKRGVYDTRKIKGAQGSIAHGAQQHVRHEALGHENT